MKIAFFSAQSYDEKFFEAEKIVSATFANIYDFEHGTKLKDRITSFTSPVSINAG